ncbi:MAG: hypothetical protein FWG87_07365 [Defluviitaleaceae bacterium]|nr:hypothetical protein [Defluviitaleaceae bacterium]
MKYSKRTLAFIFAVIFLLAVTACGGETANESGSAELPLETELPQEATAELSQEATAREEIAEAQPQQADDMAAQGEDVPTIHENDISNIDKNTDENTEVYTDGETTVTVDYSARKITIRGRGNAVFFDFTEAGNVISSYANHGEFEAPDGSMQGQETFVTATIDGDTMYYESVFILTVGGRGITAAVPEHAVSVVLRRVE